MSESFCVDVRGLGDIPAQLGVLRSMLERLDVSAPTTTAANAASVAGPAISRFGVSFDSFVKAALKAVDDDDDGIRRTAESYERCELDVIFGANTLRRQLGASGSW